MKKYSSSIILKTSNRTSITLFAKDLLHLQLPFDQSIFNSWFYCHFINIYYCPFGFMDYIDESNFAEIINIKDIGFEEYIEVNKPECFVSAISNNTYVYVWVDNFLISNSQYYKKQHKVHPILIYGYDLNQKVYYCSRFNSMKGLEKITINIEEVHNGIESAKIHFYCPTEVPLKFLSVRALKKEYNNSVGRFLGELRDYLLGKGSRDYSYYFNNQPVGSNNEFFGLQITNCFIDGLNNPGMFRLFDYRLLHMIVENKAHILEAMNYYNTVGYYKKEIDVLIEKYKNLVNRYQNMRYLFIKQSEKESNLISFYRPPTNPLITKRLIECFDTLLYEETHTIKEYLSIMKKKIIADRQTFYSRPTIVCKQKVVDFYQNRPAIKYYFDTPVNLGGIELYSSIGSFEGELFVNGEKYVCHDMNANYNFLFIDIIRKDVKSIIYCPDSFLTTLGEEDASITLFKLNITNGITMTASSVFSEIAGWSFAPENVLSPANSGTDWAPEQHDEDRWIKAEFKMPTFISTVVITQHEIEQRVIAYRVEVENNDGVHSFIVNCNDVIGCNPFFNNIGLADVVSIKVTFIDTKMDDNGYDVPRITNISFYN